MVQDLPSPVEMLDSELLLLVREDQGFGHASLVKAVRTVTKAFFDRYSPKMEMVYVVELLAVPYTTYAAATLGHRDGHDLESMREAGWLVGNTLANRDAWKARDAAEQLLKWRINMVSALASNWAKENLAMRSAWVFGFLAALDNSWAPAWNAKVPA